VLLLLLQAEVPISGDWWLLYANTADQVLAASLCHGCTPGAGGCFMTLWQTG
jgi:hypothetical protein